jgi:hypothetical protein
MENHSYDDVIGSSDTPSINALAAECGLAVNYHNVTHPQPAQLLGRHLRAEPGRPVALHTRLLAVR